MRFLLARNDLFIRYRKKYDGYPKRSKIFSWFFVGRSMKKKGKVCACMCVFRDLHSKLSKLIKITYRLLVIVSVRINVDSFELIKYKMLKS